MSGFGYGGFFFVFVLPVFGVGTTGDIVGTVTDPSGAVVPEARILLVNDRTGVEREAETNNLGFYGVTLLPPGVYTITIEKERFRPVSFKGIVLAVNQTIRIDARLELGQVFEQVLVTGEQPLLQTDSSSFGDVLDRRRVEELPLNERNFLNFALLVPGAQMPADGSQNSTTGGAVSVNGAREQSNNFLLDGVDDNDPVLNHYSVLPSVEAIAEFKVQASNSSAEFGRTGGAQINVALKSGTNEFHGSLFEFVRNRRLDAKSFFDLPDCTADSVPGACAEIPRFDRNQFGGSFGGPIVRNKTFFFTSYEGLRLREGSTRRAAVPSQNQREAALGAVPPSERNPSGEAILNLYPAANTGTDLAGSSLYTASPVIRNSLDHFLVKLDHQLTRNDSLAGHYAFYQEDRVSPYDREFPFTNLPGYGSRTDNPTHNARLTWVRVLSSRAVNEARLGFSRRSNGVSQENAGVNRSALLGFPVIFDDPADWGYPSVTLPGFDPIGEPSTLPQKTVSNTFHLVEKVAWNPGRHSLKFGADIRRQQVNMFIDPVARGNWYFFGSFTGDPLQDLLRGTPEFAVAPTGNSDTSLRSTALGFFVQDDIRVSPTFTLNLGLRYEYNSPPVELHDRFSVPDFSLNSVVCQPAPDCQFLIAGTGNIPRATYYGDKRNLAPRIGFAWLPRSQARFVIRGAYGIFNDVPIMNLNILPRFNPPFYNIQVFLNGGNDSIQSIVAGPPLPFAVQSGLISPDTKDGYLQQWNLTVEYQLLQQLVLDFAYVGSKGTNLANQREVNQPRPGDLPPYPQFGAMRQAESSVSSSYNAFQFRAEQRFARGLVFLASYTWSKAIDHGSALFGAAAEPDLPQDSLDLRSERGLSNFDARHRVAFSFLYNLPLGSGQRHLSSPELLHHIFSNWQLGSIIAAQSGRPFTVNRAIDQSRTGVDLAFSDRPDQIADPMTAGPVPSHPDPACHSTVSQGGKAADVVRDPDSWFNPCAFASPAEVRFGNAGRNTVTGPNLLGIDVSLIKRIPITTDSRRLELRFEAFNVINRPNFDLPDRMFDSVTFTHVRSANAWGNKPPRQIQLGIRYVF